MQLFTFMRKYKVNMNIHIKNRYAKILKQNSVHYFSINMGRGCLRLHLSKDKYIDPTKNKVINYA